MDGFQSGAGPSPSHDAWRPSSSSSRRSSLALGHCLRQPTQMGANDISRWCTVWSLLERGTYVIDDCPWQIETQDKVLREPKGASGPSSRQAFLFEQARAVADSDRRDSLSRTDRDRRSARPGRSARAPASAGLRSQILNRRTESKGVLEMPKDPAKWPAYIFYFKPIIVLLNVVPYAIFLVLFARRAGPTAQSAIGRGFSACCRGIRHAISCRLLRRSTITRSRPGVSSSPFTPSFASGMTRCSPRWRFAGAGFFAAFAAANELPALAILALLFCLLVVRHPRSTTAAFSFRVR